MEASTEEVLRLLRSLGLSGYESRVYLALVGGARFPREISEVSGVPASRVYDVLSRLAEKGFAVRVSKSVYSPVDPAAAAGSLAARIRAAAESRASEVESAGEKLSSMLGGAERTERLELLRGLPQIISKVISISRDSDRLYFIVRKAVEALPELRPMVASLGRAGADVRVIIPSDARLGEDDLVLAREAGVMLRASGETLFDAMVAGGRYFMLGIPDPAYPLPDKAVAVLIDDDRFASAVERYFLRLWEEARPPTG